MHPNTSLPADPSLDVQSVNEALAERIARWTGRNNRLPTAIPGLTLNAWDAPTELTHYVHEPSLCLIAQGAKRVLLGKETYTYDPSHFLISSVDLPVVAQISEASREKPYLGLGLKLDRPTIARMMADSNVPLPQAQPSDRALATGTVTAPLLNAVHRLIDLLDTPQDIAILAPLVQREILYRLLVGDQGARLRQIAASGTQSNQIAQAIDWLRDNYTQPLRVDALATYAKMSPSSFHRHFRAVTNKSPLQFQKLLRLHEARRLMLTDNLDAATAAFQVGYESHSQFNREYSRLFGAPPLRDIKKIRQVSTETRQSQAAPAPAANQASAV
ncbi:AraC family transcriptional regulator [Desulfovibrio sp. TomC]|uniref:AraC family transcriptional regulator n=1 Tax=Desulfovibrio sp. TomC TaxID=1562888 RepID=UPI000575A9C1|nr:AraC family transcriptional regulator [Desulfovibrio sp. TomC]KHK00750.1 Transcriptional regulator, AraC family [Desulfovibrio sp. TomC]